MVLGLQGSATVPGFFGAEGKTQDLMQTRQGPYQLSYIPSPNVVLLMGHSCNICCWLLVTGCPLITTTMADCFLEALSWWRRSDSYVWLSPSVSGAHPWGQTQILDFEGVVSNAWRPSLFNNSPQEATSGRGYPRSHSRWALGPHF